MTDRHRYIMALGNLPTMLMEEQCWGELEEYLTSLRFIEAKCAAEMTYNLTQEYTKALRERREHSFQNHLQPWAQFVSVQAHLLAEHAGRPGFVFQHAYNSANTGPIAETARNLLDERKVYAGPWLRCVNRLNYQKQPACVMTLLGHQGWVLTTVFSPDGHLIASGGSDHSVRIWDVETGDNIATLTGHTHQIKSCAFSPDGLRLVSASDDSTLKVWDTRIFAEIATCVAKGGMKQFMSSCGFSPDGQYIVSGHLDNTVRVWNASNGTPIASLPQAASKEGTIVCCSYSEDGTKIFALSRDVFKIWDAQTFKELVSISLGESKMMGFYSPGDISFDGRWLVAAGDREEMDSFKVWDAQTGMERCTLIGHNGRAARCAFSPDGKYIVTGGEDHSVRVWDAEWGKELAVLNEHTMEVSACCFSPDGRHIASGSWDHSVKIWSVEAINQTPPETEHSGSISSCDFSPNGSQAVSASGIIKVWDTSSMSKRIQIEGHRQGISACCFSPDGRHILSASADATLRIWDAATGVEITKLTGHSLDIRSFVCSPTGQRFLSETWSKVCERLGRLIIWDVDSDGRASMRLANALDFQVYAIAPDRHCLLTDAGPEHWKNQGVLKVVDIETGVVQASFTNHDYSGDIAAAFSWDGQLVVSSSNASSIVENLEGGTLHVWDVQTGISVAILDGESRYVNCCAFSPDGSWIVAGLADGSLDVWNWQNRSVESTLRREAKMSHDQAVKSCYYSANGRQIAAAHSDGKISLWDTASQRLIGTWLGFSCCFSSDSHRLAIGNSDGMLVILDTQTNHRIAALPTSGWVSAESFSPNGDRLVVANGTEFEVWDIVAGARIATLNEHQTPLRHLMFTADGGVLSVSFFQPVNGYRHQRSFGIQARREEVRLWDPKWGTSFDLSRESETLNVLAISPDGAQAAIASDRLRIISTDCGGELFNLAGHGPRTETAVYMLDGRLLATGGTDGTVRLWDLTTGECKRTLGKLPEEVGHAVPSPDGRYLVSASSALHGEDLTLRLWDVRSGTQIAKLEGCTKQIRECLFSPDGRLVVARLDDIGLILVWDITTGSELARVCTPGNLSSMDIRPDGRLLTSDYQGHLRLWQLENVKPGPPIVTAARMLYYGNPCEPGHWSSNLEATCPWCGSRFTPRPKIIDTIRAFMSRLTPDQAPCLHMPDEAYETPELESACPDCGQPLRFNPFIVSDKVPGTTRSQATQTSDFNKRRAEMKFFRLKDPYCVLCASDCGPSFCEMKDGRLFGADCFQKQALSSQSVWSLDGVDEQECICCWKTIGGPSVSVLTGQLCEDCAEQFLALLCSHQKYRETSIEDLLINLASDAAQDWKQCVLDKYRNRELQETEPEYTASDVIAERREVIIATQAKLLASLRRMEDTVPRSAIMRFYRHGSRSALRMASEEFDRQIETFIAEGLFEEALCLLSEQQKIYYEIENGDGLRKTESKRNLVLRLLGRRDDDKEWSSNEEKAQVDLQQLRGEQAKRAFADGDLYRALFLWQQQEIICGRMHILGGWFEAVCRQSRLLQDDLKWGMKVGPWAQKIFSIYTRAVRREDKSDFVIQFQQILVECWPHLSREVAELHFGRGSSFQKQHLYARGLADFEAAVFLDSNNSKYLNQAAWVYATCPQAEFRNGEKALNYASKACELTEDCDWAILDTRAAAHAEMGDFQKAVEWVNKALASAPPETQEYCKAMLQLYQSGKPYREVSVE